MSIAFRPDLAICFQYYTVITPQNHGRWSVRQFFGSSVGIYRISTPDGHRLCERGRKSMKRQRQRSWKTPDKKRRSRPSRRRTRGAVQTVAQYHAIPAASQERRIAVDHVVTEMRDHKVSLAQASRKFGLDPRTVVHLAGSALRKGSNGRYLAKASDRLLRFVKVLTPDGVLDIGVNHSREATLVAEHANAVHRYLETGDSSALRKFRGKRITDASGAKVSLLADLDELDRLGSAGVLSFESLYARSA